MDDALPPWANTGDIDSAVDVSWDYDAIGAAYPVVKKVAGELAE